MTWEPAVVDTDPRLPFLRLAIDPEQVARHLPPVVPGPAGELAGVVVLAIRTLRHKPGRRCLIEYELEVTRRPGGAPEVMTLLGKVRRRGADVATFDLVRALHARGFSDGGPLADGIAVPEPVALVPELGLWLQRKVEGASVTTLLLGPEGPAIARRLAEAAYKLHQAAVPSVRRHSVADELRILHGCLDDVAERRPEWAPRLQRLLRACDRLGTGTPAQRPHGIHRDFYPDHALLDGKRLYLLDLDLYSEGDPALDIGNCIAHITEQSVRVCGDPDALADREMALEDRFIELAGEAVRPAVRNYALLTLARHIWISTQLEARQRFTPTLLDLCEQRLGSSEWAVS